MRITQWGEYGIHCLVYMAKRHAAGDKTVNASDIAESQGIDLLYAQQILQRLRKSSLIDSVRGPQGGYRLCRAPSEITLHDILVAAEGDTFTVLCDSKPLSAERCASETPCSLRSIWLDLRDHVNSFLSGIKLSDLSARYEAGEPLVKIKSSGKVELNLSGGAKAE